MRSAIGKPLPAPAAVEPGVLITDKFAGCEWLETRHHPSSEICFCNPRGRARCANRLVFDETLPGAYVEESGELNGAIDDLATTHGLKCAMRPEINIFTRIPDALAIENFVVPRDIEVVVTR